MAGSCLARTIFSLRPIPKRIAKIRRVQFRTRQPELIQEVTKIVPHRTVGPKTLTAISRGNDRMQQNEKLVRALAYQRAPQVGYPGGAGAGDPDQSP